MQWILIYGKKLQRLDIHPYLQGQVTIRELLFWIPGTKKCKLHFVFSHLWGPALPFDMYCGDMMSMSEDHLNINFKN